MSTDQAPLEATLYIDLSDSRCGHCRRNADPHEPAHTMEKMRGEGCGATYVAVSSHYVNVSGLHDRIKEMRPDLPLIDGWGNGVAS